MKIILVETEGSRNIGSVARIMKNFNHKDLYLLNSKAIITEETKKMACNAQEIIEKVTTIKKLTDSGADYYIGTTALPGGDYNILRNRSEISILPNNEKVAIVLGSESQGLSNELLEQMDSLIRINANKEYSTLNISHALAIILYEFFNEESETQELASQEQKERLLKLFEESLNKENMNDHEQKTASLAFKKLLGRAAVTKREIQALFGSFKRL